MYVRRYFSPHDIAAVSCVLLYRFFGFGFKIPQSPRSLFRRPEAHQLCNTRAKPAGNSRRWLSSRLAE